jgi:anti-sigma factor RsiW
MRHQPKQIADHPNEENVLLLLGGELTSREARALKVHFEQCAECRERIQEMQAGMCAFGDYIRKAFLPAVGAPPKEWREFRGLLDRITAKSPSRIKRRTSRPGAQASS